MRVFPTPVSVPVTNNRSTVSGFLISPRAQLAFEFVQGNVRGLLAGAAYFGSGAPRLAEYDFVSSGQPAVGAEGLIGGLHGGKFARTGESLEPADGCIPGPDRLEIRGQMPHVGVRQSIAFYVEHRRRKAGAHQRVPNVMHVEEVADPSVVVRIRAPGPRPGGTQFPQGIGTQGREGQEAARCEYAPEFRQGCVQVAPLQHEITDDEVYAAIRQG